MAPVDDASCRGSAIGNPLTTLRKQDTIDRSVHQDKLRPNSDNGLGQTMRSGLQEPTLDFQKTFDAFENQDAALRLVEMVGRDRQQEQDHMTYDRVWAAVVDERPFAGQYAEIDLILRQHADLGPREMKQESGELVARPKSYADEIDIGRPPQQEQQRLSPELSFPTCPPDIHLSHKTTTNISHLQAWVKFAKALLPIFPPAQLSENWEPALHYLDVYRIAVQDNLSELRDVAIAMLTAKDIKMPDVNEGLRRGDIKDHTADFKGQSRSKASGSHREAGKIVLYADGSEFKAAQESHIEENPAPAPPSVIIHHSIMFRFLDKLYASPDHKNSQDADASQKRRDPEFVVLRQPVLLHLALSILKMEDNEELGMLRDKYDNFHEELHSALEAVRQEYEDVVENEHGDWILRLREGMKVKAKL